jgi:integrase
MPNRISLTQLGVERIRPQATDQMFWDRTLPGYGLRVSPKGRKSFICQYRVRGRKGSAWKERQVVLGTLAFLTVGEARERARRYKSRASEGVDPVEELKAAKQAEVRKQQADAFTFARLVERYQNEYVIRRKPSGIAEKKRLLGRWLPTLGDKPISEIAEADLLKFVNELLRGKTKGRHEADNLVGAVKHLYTWAQKQTDPALRGVSNPAAKIVHLAEPGERDRYLSHAEIQKLWVAADAIGWPGGQILKLLLLTGQRLNEVAQCRWSEWDLPNKIWHLPAARAKNSRAHDIHLSDLAMEIIQELPRVDHSEWVFTLDGRLPCNTDHLRERAHRLMGEGIEPWQLRDIRRTSTTLLAELGVAPHVADKVLNHVGSGQIRGVAAIYNRFTYLPERKQALEALGRKVEQLIGRGSDNVVALVRA